MYIFSLHCIYIKINFLILALSDQFKGAQALECLAFIAFLVTVVVIVLKLFVMKDKHILHIVMALGNFIAGKLLI
jgi:Mn2+/Fe2+ NRAMP family transporter